MEWLFYVIIAAPLGVVVFFLISAAFRAIQREWRAYDLEKRFARSRVAGWEYRHSWAVVAMVTCIGIFWALKYTSWSGYNIIFMMLWMVFAFIDLTYIRSRRYRAFFKHVRESDYKMCTQCLYSLVGSPATGLCPECGTSYTYDTLRDEWIDIARKNRVMLPKLLSEDRTREP